MVGKAEIQAGNWKPLFNAMMKAFFDYTEGRYMEYRYQQELKKHLKAPGVITVEEYNNGTIPRARYQEVEGSSQYYYFNSYGVFELLKAMKDEMKLYIDFVNHENGTQSGYEEVKISYALPEGEYTEMFRE